MHVNDSARRLNLGWMPRRHGLEPGALRIGEQQGLPLETPRPDLSPQLWRPLRALSPHPDARPAESALVFLDQSGELHDESRGGRASHRRSASSYRRRETSASHSRLTDRADLRAE